MDQIFDAVFSSDVKNQALAVDSLIEVVKTVPSDQVPRIFCALTDGTVKCSESSFRTLAFLLAKACEYLDFRYYYIKSSLLKLNLDCKDVTVFEKLLSMLACIRWENTPEQRLRNDNADLKVSYGPLVSELWKNLLANAPPNIQIRAVNYACKKVLPFVRIPNAIPLIFHVLTSARPDFQIMHSLYKLIVNENMEFRSFYSQLSKIISYEAFHENKKNENLCLLSTFLSSDKLPSSYAAHFLKKLMQLSLFSSSEIVLFMLASLEVFLENTPSLRIMIQNDGGPLEESFVQSIELDANAPPLYEFLLLEKLFYACFIKFPNFTEVSGRSNAVALFFDSLDNYSHFRLLQEELKKITFKSCPISSTIPLTLL